MVGTGGDEAGRLASVTIAHVDGPPETVEADLLLVSGGWNPNVALWSQARGTLRFDDRIAAFVPDRPGPHGRMEAVGAAAGDIADLGTIEPLWIVPPPGDDPGEDAWATHYVDLQRDSTARDLRRALGAGLTSIEHVKRYTTIGTAADQGKTSGVVASAIAAAILGQEVGAVGVPTYRPPVIPVSASRSSPAATAATCSTPSGSPRSMTGTSPAARSSRTSASGSGRATSRSTASRWRPRSCASARPRGPGSR